MHHRAIRTSELVGKMGLGTAFKNFVSDIYGRGSMV